MFGKWRNRFGKRSDICRAVKRPSPSQRPVKLFSRSMVPAFGMPGAIRLSSPGGASLAVARRSSACARRLAANHTSRATACSGTTSRKRRWLTRQHYTADFRSGFLSRPKLRLSAWKLLLTMGRGVSCWSTRSLGLPRRVTARHHLLLLSLLPLSVPIGRFMLTAANRCSIPM